MSILSTPHDEIMYASHTSQFDLDSSLLLEELFYRIFRVEVSFLKICDKTDSPKVKLLAIS